jgi:cytochrome c oxidase cbb3-type subunit III
MSQELDKTIEGHEYDGIQEFDNPLPNWWLFTFLATVIFAIVYYFQYEISGAPNQAAELQESLASIQSLKKASPNPTLDENGLKALFTEQALESGKATFQAKCAACHGAAGEGLIGPNLTDNHFIHGGSALATYEIISEGVLDKGMPPWKDQISHDELVGVTYFVHNMKGTFAPNGKPEQGNPEGEGSEGQNPTEGSSQ